MRDQIEDMEENKNYFAMALKLFFTELGAEQPDLLELLCHNYVHKWVNKEAANKPKNNSKYAVEAKIAHIQTAKHILNRKDLENDMNKSQRLPNLQDPFNLPRYMQPTLNNLNKVTPNNELNKT